MIKLKLLSTALVAAAMLATPAMARESQVTSRYPAKVVDGISAALLRASAHLPPSPGITAPLANPRRAIDPPHRERNRA
jgi:hypothetical protein